MMRIWGRRTSLNVQKVLWLLEELGAPSERVPAGGPEGRLDEPAFGALNPNRLVPVLEVEGRGPIWESHAILRYLAAAHGGASWWPADPFARSHIDRWTDWTATHWQPAFIDGVFWGFWRTPEAKRDERAIARALERCAALAQIVETQLAATPYLVGTDLTIADIAFGASLYRWFELPISRPSTPRLEHYYARLKERRAYGEAVMIEFDSLKGRLAWSD